MNEARSRWIRRQRALLPSNLSYVSDTLKEVLAIREYMQSSHLEDSSIVHSYDRKAMCLAWGCSPWYRCWFGDTQRTDSKDWDQWELHMSNIIWKFISFWLKNIIFSKFHLHFTRFDKTWSYLHFRCTRIAAGATGCVNVFHHHRMLIENLFVSI